MVTGGTFYFAYGVLGDVTTPPNRGGYVGFISIFLNTPPSVAPLVSGYLLIKRRWPSIFWFLSASSFAVFLAILLFLPETCRQVVGNGSHTSPKIHQPLVSLLVPKTDTNITSYTTHGRAGGITDTANPLLSLTLLKCRSTSLAIACYSIYYTVYSCLQASLSTAFVEIYGVSGVVAGLSYIPFGLACIIASSLAGKILDYDYRRMTESLGSPVQYHQIDEVSAFPVERTRLRISKYFIMCCGPIIVAYGWALQTKQHIALPLVLQFMVGFTNQINFTSLNTVLVDLHPDRPSTVQAINNFFRCELAAGGLAVLDVMLKALGPGWCFVIFAALHLITLPIFWIMEQHGLKWRRGNQSSPAQRQS